jgi:hypothetical protein
MHTAHTMKITRTLKQKTQTSYEHALANTSLWEDYSSIETDHYNTSELQSQLKLTYIYNFKKICKDKPRALDYGAFG